MSSEQHVVVQRRNRVTETDVTRNHRGSPTTVTFPVVAGPFETVEAAEERREYGSQIIVSVAGDADGE
jgi:hypothetical protein